MHICITVKAKGGRSRAVEQAVNVREHDRLSFMRLFKLVSGTGKIHRRATALVFYIRLRKGNHEIYPKPEARCRRRRARSWALGNREQLEHIGSKSFLFFDSVNGDRWIVASALSIDNTFDDWKMRLRGYQLSFLAMELPFLVNGTFLNLCCIESSFQLRREQL